MTIKYVKPPWLLCDFPAVDIPGITVAALLTVFAIGQDFIIPTAAWAPIYVRSSQRIIRYLFFKIRTTPMILAGRRGAGRGGAGGGAGGRAGGEGGGGQG